MTDGLVKLVGKTSAQSAWSVLSYGLFTPPTRTRQFCLVRVGGVNKPLMLRGVLASARLWSMETVFPCPTAAWKHSQKQWATYSARENDVTNVYCVFER